MKKLTGLIKRLNTTQCELCNATAKYKISINTGEKSFYNGGSFVYRTILTCERHKREVELEVELKEIKENILPYREIEVEKGWQFKSSGIAQIIGQARSFIPYKEEGYSKKFLALVKENSLFFAKQNKFTLLEMCVMGDKDLSSLKEFTTEIKISGQVFLQLQVSLSLLLIYNKNMSPYGFILGGKLFRAVSLDYYTGNYKPVEEKEKEIVSRELVENDLEPAWKDFSTGTPEFFLVDSVPYEMNLHNISQFVWDWGKKEYVKIK